MNEKLNKIKEEALKKINEIKNSEKLKELEVFYLGRKGELTKILRDLANLSMEEKKNIGQTANEMKKELEEIFKKSFNMLRREEEKDIFEKERIDVTRPSLEKKKLGHVHPITQIQYEIEDIFTSMGFMVLDGPELESEYYNFIALNIPSWHPARDMQDTFYVSSRFHVTNPKEEENRLVMRAHTSPVQVRAMQKYGAPIKAIVPGRVFRCEATDARHDTTFDQVEGFMIDEKASVSSLSAVSKEFLTKIFRKEIKYRFRPGYFPFVEPGVEVDLLCMLCGGKGCRVCKGTGWVEFMGAGMIHPNVLKAGGIDHNKYQGFAFGFGMTRLAMMKHGINDIRLFQSGDLRFLEQF